MRPLDGGAIHRVRVVLSLAAFYLCLAGYSAEAGTVTLAWDANSEPDVAGYVLSIGVAPGQYTNTVNVGNQTSYLFSEPNPAVVHYFSVRAYNTAGLFSPHSVELSSAPSAPPPPPPPGSGFTLVWDANTEPDLAGYVLSIGLAPGQYTNTVGVGNQTMFFFVEPDATIPYFFALRAYNSAGVLSSFTQELQSVPLQLPSVTTGAATSVNGTGATLNGAANPRGATTSGYYQFGNTAGYGTQTALANLGSLNQNVAIPGASLTGLTCNTTYHFRAAAISTAGTTFGSNATFVTAGCPAPTVTTGAAISITPVGATLTATVDTRGTPTTVSFSYGLTTQYGSVTAGTTTASGIGSVAIPIAALTCGTVYHYRAVASATGMAAVLGADATFATGACSQPPTITLQPKDVKINKGETATLSVQATGSGPLTYQWYVGTAGVTTQPIAGATAAIYRTPPLTVATKFWVRVSNQRGTTDSRTATVTTKGR